MIPAAADWTIKRLPSIYQPVMKRAKSICIGTEKENWENVKSLIQPCVNYMIKKINAQILLINFDDSTKSIRLDENTTNKKS